MAGLQIHREDAAGCVTLRLEGTLDGRTAREVHASLDACRGCPEVVLDFSHLREFRDAAVPELTPDLCALRVRLRGLGEHHTRVLRCFGVVVAREAPRASPVAEEALAG